jgi:hypothetical protein
MTTREVMEGRMAPVVDPDRERATRRAFLAAMGVVLLAVAGHLAFILGTCLSPFLQH